MCIRDSIEGLSEATLEKLIGRGWIHSYLDLYRLDQHRDEIIRMEGFGVKSWPVSYTHLDVYKRQVRPRTEKGFFTVTVPPPWNGPARRAAQAVQDQIKEWSKQYPNVVCYCFDSYSTLVYVL